MKNLNIVPIPDVGRLEKLKTMGCDEIEGLLFNAIDSLNSSGDYLMAACLPDLIEPIRLERERAEYRWVLASQHPEAPGQVYEGYPAQLSGQPAVDPSELREDIFGCEPGRWVVAMKRVRAN
jgi:hypothetical protein